MMNGKSKPGRARLLQAARIYTHDLDAGGTGTLNVNIANLEQAAWLFVQSDRSVCIIDTALLRRLKGKK